MSVLYSVKLSTVNYFDALDVSCLQISYSLSSPSVQPIPSCHIGVNLKGREHKFISVNVTRKLLTPRSFVVSHRKQFSYQISLQQIGMLGIYMQLNRQISCNTGSLSHKLIIYSLLLCVENSDKQSFHYLFPFTVFRVHYSQEAYSFS